MQLTPRIAQVFSKVMAQQVRPGLTKPARFKGHRQSVDLIRRQPAYSIRARGQVPFNEAECMAAISTCDPEPKMMLGNKGGVRPSRTLDSSAASSPLPPPPPSGSVRRTQQKA